MNALAGHAPAPFYQAVNKPDLSLRPKAEGSKFKVNYFTFSVTLPICATDFQLVELSDSELLLFTEKAGTFDFLNSPEEDVYNDVLKKQP
jgi:hypothetical protein